MNPRLEALHAYPFGRLARLKAGLTPPPALKHIAMSIGEPQHAPPQCLLETLRRSVDELGRVRISLVPPLRQCVEAAERIRDFLRAPPAAVRNLRA
jgi:N-succinyldiaminopimelate aminotransferase